MLTSAQSSAIAATGNVLVMAGAGTGKTRTLVDRCLERVVRERRALSEMLLVTFTEAAAMEIRHRLRLRLREALNDARLDAGLSQHLLEQTRLLDAAAISTLHGFCLRLLREHFYRVGLDPRFAVMDANAAALLAAETATALLERYLDPETADASAAAVHALIDTYGLGHDGPIREQLLRLARFARSLPDAAAWLESQRLRFEARAPAAWNAVLCATWKPWRERWLELLTRQLGEHPYAQDCVAILKQLPDDATPAQAARVLEAIEQQRQGWQRQRGVQRKPLERFLDDVQFLRSLVCRGAGASASADPIAEDWGLVRGHLGTLARLALEFLEAFTRAKRDAGVVDFQDLEQLALQLLWDPQAGAPTELAQSWRGKLAYVLVDEYQDINAAQDRILEALGRPPPAGNRFLVGDVKQSIYRFRLANPAIFQSYAATWSADPSHGCVLSLAENFRSHEAIVGFVNELFDRLWREPVDGVGYGAQARLQFGAPEARGAQRISAAEPPRVELHLVGPPDAAECETTAGDDTLADDAAEVFESLPGAEREARLLADRLRALRAGGFEVWDRAQARRRPAQWKDMVILLRAPSSKAEVYAKAFARAGVPLHVMQGGFFDSAEISDLLALARVLDNPLQDIPLLAVLRSPLVGLTPNELAVIRILHGGGCFWDALIAFDHWARTGGCDRPRTEARAGAPAGLSEQVNSCAREAAAKTRRFMEDLPRWRMLARQLSLAECLDAVLAETHYEAWLQTQTRAEQRLANIRRLLLLARRFDRFQRHSVVRFLRFVEAQEAAGLETEAPMLPAEDAVQLMSIHQSKGLEFPIVALGAVGSRFNLRDLQQDLILDPHEGLCACVRDATRGAVYPTLTHWRARQRLREERVGEELRLLYVACTRGCDLLLLVGGVASVDGAIDGWQRQAALGWTAQRVCQATRPLDWIGGWLAEASGDAAWPRAVQGRHGSVRWQVWTASPVPAPPQGSASPSPASHGMPEEAPSPGAITTDVPSRALLDVLKWRLSWSYPHLAATREPAKASVTALRRRAIQDEGGETWRPAFTLEGTTPRRGPGELDAAEVGTAHHRFIQHLDLASALDPQALAQAADRFQELGVLSPAERRALDLESIAAFWDSATGREIRAQAAWVQREIAFTARFATTELAQLGVMGTQAEEGGEVLVQGAADLVVLRPDEIWLLDFKTDRVDAAGVEAKVARYRPQLVLYSRAFERIYQCRVTKRWLHFLDARRTVDVADPAAAFAGETAPQPGARRSG